MKSVDPKELSIPEIQALLQGVIAPRPIAFASTIDRAGQVNLSPFSFFNMFSMNPPVLVFSPSRRGRDGTSKHTLENVYEVPEVAISMVDYAMVEQMSLASTEYPKGVNEFVKAGLVEEPSERIAPPRVKGAPASFECKISRIIPLGSGGGAGNLVVCEVLRAHFRSDLFNEQGVIDPHKADLVARMGGDWYCRANGGALFQVAKPLTKKGIGVDQLPADIRLSQVLTGNELGKLANVEDLPMLADLWHLQVPDKLADLSGHALVSALLKENLLMHAWKVLLEK